MTQRTRHFVPQKLTWTRLHSPYGYMSFKDPEEPWVTNGTIGQVVGAWENFGSVDGKNMMVRFVDRLQAVRVPTHWLTGPWTEGPPDDMTTAEIMGDSSRDFPLELCWLKSSHPRGHRFQVWGPHDWPGACGDFTIADQSIVEQPPDDYARQWALEGPRYAVGV